MDCREEKELFARAWDLLDDYAAPELSDDFTHSLMRRIYSEEIEKQRAASYGLPRFILRPIVPVLTSFLVVVLTFTIFWKRPAPPGSLSKTTYVESTGIITDDEDIIKDLDIIENLDLLENVKLLTELDIIEELNGST
ncbi:MAG TPA: hypothetical protein DCL35_03285 [Candidatus Omnitrophica bacterium]|nr:hypothetical protein [Candidatus Omnitrophota bacterium]